jgi:hypothetical protein
MAVPLHTSHPFPVSQASKKRSAVSLIGVINCSLYEMKYQPGSQPDGPRVRARVGRRQPSARDPPRKILSLAEATETVYDLAMSRDATVRMLARC